MLQDINGILSNEYWYNFFSVSESPIESFILFSLKGLILVIVNKKMLPDYTDYWFEMA